LPVSAFFHKKSFFNYSSSKIIQRSNENTKKKHFSAENANLNLSFLIVCILMFRSLEVGRQIATFKYQAKVCISFQTS
jgi:hypothetical protein